MKYHDGQEVRVGDRVRTHPFIHGTVVFIVSDGAWAPGYLPERWSFDDTKLGIYFDGTFTEWPEIQCLDEPDEDLVLVARDWPTPPPPPPTRGAHIYEET